MSSNLHRKRRSRSAYGIDLDSPNKVKQTQREQRLKSLGRVAKYPAVAFFIHLLQHAGSLSSALVHSRWLMLLPFAALLAIESVDFLVLRVLQEGSGDNLLRYRFGFGGLEDDRGPTGADGMAVERFSAERLKSEFRVYAYALTLVLALVHWREVYRYFRQWPHLVLLSCYLLFTAIFSINPVMVLANTSTIVLGFLSAILFATAYAADRRYIVCYTIVFIPILILNTGSFLLFLWQDTHLIDFIFSSQRYGGLAGNPNSQGAIAVLGFWAAACLVLARSVPLGMRIVAVAGAILFVLNIVMAGSGTSITAIVLVTIALFWLRVLTFFKPDIQKALNIGVTMILVVFLILIVASSTVGDLFLLFTDSLGKDATLTGRTYIWSVAREAIAVQPFFGWGYDSHASVMASGAYQVNYSYYHNGFLDTMVSGGVVLLLIVLYNLTCFARVFFLGFKGDPDLFPMLVPLIMLLVFNLSEYSLLRPNNPIWGVYVLVFVMLTFHWQGKWFGLIPNLKKTKRNATANHRSRKRQLRWN